MCCELKVGPRDATLLSLSLECSTTVRGGAGKRTLPLAQPNVTCWTFAGAPRILWGRHAS